MQSTRDQVTKYYIPVIIGWGRILENKECKK